MFEWFTNKILPTIMVAMSLAVVNMYVEFTAKKKSDTEYRHATKEFRDKNAIRESKQWTYIKTTDIGLARLEERCVSKDIYYINLIKNH